MKSEVIWDSMDRISEAAIANSAASVIPAGAVLIVVRSGILARTVPVAITGRTVTVNQDLKALCPKPMLASRFLYYLLQCRQAELLDRVTRGATVHRLTTEDIRTICIDLPPLAEQERIVDVLDEAFEAIATVKANAQRNFQNARALFESHRQSVFSVRGEGWVETTVDRISTNLDSKRVPITKADRMEGQYPYYGASGIVDYVADYIFQGDTLLVSEDGANLLMRSSPIAFSVSGKYWVNNHAHVLKFVNIITQRYVEFYLESVPLDDYITGAAQPKLTQKALNSIPIPIPTRIEDQARVVESIDRIRVETERLVSIYQRKLTVLDELKKSLLNRAFAGELTASESPVIPISAATGERTKAERGLTTTDLHAGILALAYRAHERAGRLPYFGHVKAEKVAHMVEARLGIDLGRMPVKDAAGPNDYPHLMKVEHRARNARFFDFRRDGSRYVVSPLRGFDRLVERTRDDLGEQYQDVVQLIELMVKMDTEQAEIVATVYAAWNNLLLDGLPATDEDIVRAAREDWHPDKLKIERDRFFKAIEWMREKDLTPTGTGPRVADKPASAIQAKKRR